MITSSMIMSADWLFLDRGQADQPTYHVTALRGVVGCVSWLIAEHAYVCITYPACEWVSVCVRLFAVYQRAGRLVAGPVDVGGAFP